MLNDVLRYKNKILKPLKHHTTSDTSSKELGDIELIDADGSVFECVEVKHSKPISFTIISNIYQKIKGKNVNRYYILTTEFPNIDSETKDKVEDIQEKNLFY